MTRTFSVHSTICDKERTALHTSYWQSSLKYKVSNKQQKSRPQQSLSSHLPQSVQVFLQGGSEMDVNWKTHNGSVCRSTVQPCILFRGSPFFMEQTHSLFCQDAKPTNTPAFIHVKQQLRKREDVKRAGNEAATFHSEPVKKPGETPRVSTWILKEHFGNDEQKKKVNFLHFLVI